MSLKFSPNNAVRARPIVFGLRDQYLIYIVLLALTGLVISGNAAWFGCPAWPVILTFAVLITGAYFYFRRIDRRHDSGYFDRLLAFRLSLPRRVRARPIIHHQLSAHEKVRQY